MPRNVYPKRSAKELAALRHAYQDTAEPVTDIVRRFGLLNHNELYSLVKHHGWRKRGQNAAANLEKANGLAGRLAQANGGRRGMYRGAAEWAADQRRAEEQHLEKLYGRDLSAVRLLQRRGYFVTRERDGYRFERQHLTSAQLRAKAARESRLTGVT